jgi:Cu2+-exporting ATPase
MDSKQHAPHGVGEAQGRDHGGARHGCTPNDAGDHNNRGAHHNGHGQHSHAARDKHAGHLERAAHGRDPHTDHAAHDKHAGHSPEMFRSRFWLSLLLALPILFFDPHLQQWLGYRAPAFPGSNWLQPLLAILLYLYGGGVFVKGAVSELRARQPGMMTLIGLAITVAFGYSLAVTLGLPGMALYWELATLILVMLLGHWIEMASVQGASRALEHLASLVPSTAHRLTGDRTVEVPVADLTAGDSILVRPGEQVPADGTVLDGASSVNEAFLTGESRPVAKEPGGQVVAGSVNGEGSLTVRVERTGERTTLSQIQRLVAEAQLSRSRFQGLADRAAAWLTYIAVGAGSVTLIAWLASGSSVDFAITRTVTVLVMACPHALGLAIPLVIVNATSMSARNGILVRNREAFERARDLELVAFDKTGTLTEGSFGVRAIYRAAQGTNAGNSGGSHAAGLPATNAVESEAPGAAAENSDNGASAENEVLVLAAALEARGEHPLATAVVDEADRRGLARLPVGGFEVSAGRGVVGEVAGRRLRIGRPEWLEELGLALPEELRRGLAEAESRGESVIVLADDSRALALFALADKIRASAREAVRRLRADGVQVVMVTGDSEAVAGTVAGELGIERYHARVLPGHKARIVAQLKGGGAIAFVGDGINDAPALLEADLGIAIGAGTNIAIESADLVLVENDPLAVVRALSLSRASYGKMIQNLFWATGYNAIALPLAAGVAYAWGILLSPAVGAIFMSASTVIVAVNAVLLRRTRLG